MVTSSDLFTAITVVAVNHRAHGRNGMSVTITQGGSPGVSLRSNGGQTGAIKGVFSNAHG